MTNFFIKLKREIFPIGLIFILILAKLIPHSPNFTPIIAAAMLSGYFFKNIYLSFLTLLISMLLADAFIGFYNNMFFVYSSLFLITFIFFKISKQINYKNLFVYSFVASLIFFIISNFGVWVLESPGAYNVPYEKNLEGLIECYVMAIPFFRNTLLSSIIFSYSTFFAFNIFENRFSKKFS